MEHERKPQFEEVFMAAIHGNLRYYYPFLAYETGKFAAVFLMGSAMFLNNTIKNEIRKR